MNARKALMMHALFVGCVVMWVPVALAQSGASTGEFETLPGEGAGAATAPPGQALAPKATELGALPQPQPATALGSDSSGAAIERLVSEHPDWACTYESHALTERHVIVGCQEGSVLTFARTSTGVQLVARRQLEGRVAGFYEQDGAVWIRVVQENAERVVPGKVLGSGGDDGTESARSGEGKRNAADVAPNNTRGPSSNEPHPSGTVKAVEGRDVVVSFPQGHELEVGSHLSLSLVSNSPFLTPEPVVGRVARVMDDQVLVTTGMNEIVEVGYVAEVTEDRPTASRRNPPRVFDVWELRALLRPMLNIGAVGGGITGEFGVAKRSEFFRFGVELAPIAVAGATGQDTLFSGGGYVFGAVDHQVYSAGVGLGVNTVNDTDFESEEGSGLTVVQLLRIGAVDGLHLSSRVEAVIFRSEVLFSFLQLQGQLGVADNAWLIVRGGGGSIGYGFGEVVVRNLLWGTGHAGSAFMELGLGGAGLFRQACTEPPLVVPLGTDFDCVEREVSGPTFTAGLEWRL